MTRNSVEKRERRRRQESIAQESIAQESIAQESLALKKIMAERSRNSLRFGLVFTLILIAYAAQAAPVSFRQAVQHHLNTSEKLQIQRQAVDTAEWQLRTNQYQFFPTLSFFGAREESEKPHVTTNGVGAVAKLNLFRGGADWAAYQASHAGLRSAQYTETVVQLGVEAEIVSLLLEAVQKTDEVNFLNLNLTNQSRYLGIVERKYKNGSVPLEQVDKVRIDLANIEAGLRDAEITLEKVKGSLHAKLGTTDVNFEWPWRTLLSDKSRLDAIIARVEKKNFEDRPDLKAARESYEQAQRLRRAAYGTVWPEINLELQAVRREVNEVWSDGWTGKLTFSIPIFEGLTKYSAFQIQANEATISGLNLQLLQKEIQTAVPIAASTFRISLRTALERENVSAVAKRLLQSSQRRFEIGRIEADELGQDQQRTILAESAASRGWLEAHLSFLRWIQSRGLSVLEFIPN